MALAVNQNSGTQGSTASTATPSLTTVSGSLLVVYLTHYDATNTPANGDITDNKGNSYTLLESRYLGPASGGVGIWYNDAGTRGASHTITGTITAGSTGFGCCSVAVCEITGQNTGSAADAATHANNNDSTSPYVVTAAAAISGNQIAIVAISPDDNGSAGTFTPPTGYTLIFDAGGAINGADIFGAYKINETGTPAPSTSWSTAGGSFGAQAFATFKEATGGQDPDVPNLRPYPVPQLNVYRM